MIEKGVQQKISNLNYYKRVFLLFILCSKILESNSQYQLKIILRGKVPSQVTEPQYTINNADTIANSLAIRTNSGDRFVGVASICLVGMWAFYNQTSFGEGKETTTTVISIKGTDINSCTPMNAVPGLNNVMSFNFLGNPITGQDGVDIYTEPYFLGGVLKITNFDVTFPSNVVLNFITNAITGIKMGSLAITNTRTAAAAGIRLCADSACNRVVICIDMTMYAGGFYFVRNTLNDTVTNWPRVIRAVQRVSSTVCRQDLNPPVPTARSQTEHDNIWDVQIN